MTRPIRVAAALSLAALALASACKQTPPPPPAATDAPAPAPVAVSTVDLGRAIGADMRVSTPLTVFGVRDTIYASVATTGQAATALVTALWTFGDGQLVDSTSIAIAPTGPAVTEFHIIRATAWPVGQYTVAILLNGVPATERRFDVK